MTPDQMREQIIQSLAEQGFCLDGDRLLPPNPLDKETVRRLHRAAVEHRRAKARPRLERYEADLLSRFASGQEVVPEAVNPYLVEVAPNSEDELLFRYACLHWSIPVSSGYGRRLRFLVFDRQNDKLIGLFGLGDPVFSLEARDRWIGWTQEARKERLHHVMDAFVLGAMPPYSFLLCGKLVAMLVASDEVRMAFERKYGSRQSLIKERLLDGRLVLVTTTSALGRSSLYRRLSFCGRPLFLSVGFTKGSGEFQFLNGTYDAMRHFVTRHCRPTAKQERWGIGFRNRREVIRQCLASVGLSLNWNYHGIQREIFVVPIAENAQSFLAGLDSHPVFMGRPSSDLFAQFRERWLLPRAKRDPSYREFAPSSLRLWQ